jgi:hypothetical protein
MPANPGKVLGCYRGLPRVVIRLRAAQKTEEKQRRKERQREARHLLFDTGRGLMKNLSRAERVFVNRAIHESHDLHWLRRFIQGVERMRFRAFRPRWYGAQKLNWQRFDVPRVISDTFFP